MEGYWFVRLLNGKPTGCTYLMKALPKKMALMKGWMEDCSVER